MTLALKSKVGINRRAGMFDRVEKRDVPILDMIDVKSPHHRENKTCVRAAHGLVQRSNSSTDTGRGLFTVLHTFIHVTV